MVKHQKVAFILAATNHGTIILNRLDSQPLKTGDGIYGVGAEILERGGFEQKEVDEISALIQARRTHFGDGVIVIDCGANIGVHTIEWAKRMSDWGKVIAIEAQERIFYALAGNIALNNCFNARAIHAAAAETCGTMKISLPVYTMPANFGGLELRRSENSEFIGQILAENEQNLTEIPCISLDSLGLKRIDLIKIDVEGMELAVLAGSCSYLKHQRPIVVVEHTKTGVEHLFPIMKEFGYDLFQSGMNVICIHSNDPVHNNIFKQKIM